MGEDSGKARSGLLDRLEFPKAILEVAGETVKAERRIKANEEQDRVIAAWQELFHEVKSQKTHRIVERIVADIDGIVQNLWFPGWQKTFLDSQRYPPSEPPEKASPIPTTSVSKLLHCTRRLYRSDWRVSRLEQSVTWSNSVSLC